MDGKPHTTIGVVSLILGIISILIMMAGFVMPYMVGYAEFGAFIILAYLLYLVGIPGAIIAIVLGYLAKKQGDSYGLIGLILGAIVLILMVISIIIAAITYAYVSSMLPPPPT